MKYRLLFSVIVLLLCCRFGEAQQLTEEQLARIPMTKVQRAMLNITDPADLKTAYDTLTTSYDQRYFINALPGYFKMKNIQTIPVWVNDAVIAALASKDPLLVDEAVRAAGVLKVPCATELMDLYKTVHTTFGCNENMIKSAILVSLIPMSDANKQQFYYGLLINEPFPILSASFGALLEALNSQPSQTYLPKLAEYSSNLDSLATKMASQKPPDYRLELCRQVLAKVNNLRGSISLGTEGGR
jgi:hypothetical protein